MTWEIKAQHIQYITTGENALLQAADYNIVWWYFSFVKSGMDTDLT